MLGSPNGPAYGTQPKLVVMKVLCKLRWRKIRHPHIFSHSPSSFILHFSLSASPCLFILFSALTIFLTRCIFSLSLSLSQWCPLSFLPSFYSLSASLSVSQAVPHFTIIVHALFPLCLLHAYPLLCLFAKVNLSLLLSFLFHSPHSLVFLRHSYHHLVCYLLLFAIADTLICFPSPVLVMPVGGFFCVLMYCRWAKTCYLCCSCVVRRKCI